MIKTFLILFGLSLSLCSFSKDEIDYQHKRLLSSLKKCGISDFSQLQEIKIEPNSLNEIQGKLYRVAGNNGGDIKYVYVGRVNSCRAGGCCNAVKITGTEDSEYFDYFIFYDSLKTVKLVDVYNYQATHGYEITAKGWLKQFVGFSGKDTLLVNKDIDGISGATISVFAITEDIQRKTETLKSIK